jgi:hypothetical protein
MENFLQEIRRQAQESLRATFGIQVPMEVDPILELIGCLLEDGAGGVRFDLANPITTDQWLTWNRLVLYHQEAIVRTVTRVIRGEKSEVPTEIGAMRCWAAWLVVMVLDRMGMA